MFNNLRKRTFSRSLEKSAESVIQVVHHRIIIWRLVIFAERIIKGSGFHAN